MPAGVDPLGDRLHDRVDLTGDLVGVQERCARRTVAGAV